MSEGRRESEGERKGGNEEKVSEGGREGGRELMSD